MKQQSQVTLPKKSEFTITNFMTRQESVTPGSGGSPRTQRMAFEVNHNYQMFGEENERDHSREARMAEAIEEVKVKKLQKRERVIESYF